MNLPVIKIDSRKIDDESIEGYGGYAPIANTVWTWYRIVGERLGFYLFFYSFARRLDATHTLWALAINEHEKARVENELPTRVRYINSFSIAEVTVIALHRVLEMTDTLVKVYCTDLEIPESAKRIESAVREMRNSFEHIDERAEAKANLRGKFHPDALTIFVQTDYIESLILRYKEFSLNFREDINEVLLDCRKLAMEGIDSRAVTHNARLDGMEKVGEIDLLHVSLNIDEQQ